MDDLISRQQAIEVLRNRWLKTRNYDGIGEDIAEECEIYLKTLPSVQPETNCSEIPNNSDTISRQAAIDKITKRLYETAFNNVGIKQNIDETLVDVAENRLENWFNELPSTQSEDWMERNKERILQAGMEGREIEFRIGGRLFAIREKAQ